MITNNSVTHSFPPCLPHSDNDKWSPHHFPFTIRTNKTTTFCITPLTVPRANQETKIIKSFHFWSTKNSWPTEKNTPSLLDLWRKSFDLGNQEIQERCMISASQSLMVWFLWLEGLLGIWRKGVWHHWEVVLALDWFLSLLGTWVLKLLRRGRIHFLAWLSKLVRPFCFFSLFLPFGCSFLVWCCSRSWLCL